MTVAERTLSHIRKLDGSLGACVHEPIAALRVEFGRRDDLSQLLHVSGFDVNNVEALILNVQIPKIDPKIVATYEGLAVAIHGNAVDVIGMGVGVDPARNRSSDGVMMS